MRPSRIRITTGAAGPVTHVATGSLTAQAASISGTSAVIKKHDATGSLTAQDASITGTAARLREFSSTGALIAQDASIAGTALRTDVVDHVATGSLTAQDAAISGTAVRSGAALNHVATGALSAQDAAVTGTAVVIKLHDATGSLTAQDSAITGTATVVKIHDATGALVAQSATITGTAQNGTAVAIPGGGGRGSSRSGYKNFVSRKQEKKIISDITSLIEVEKAKSYTPDSSPDVVSPAGVERVINSLLKAYDPKPVMKKYELTMPEALGQIEHYTRSFIAHKNDDAMALMLIMGMI